MNNDKLFIPTLCKVGFQARSDTYTGKLGYIIAYDGKKWRKEPSWKGWCQVYKSEEDVEAELEILYQRELRRTETDYRQSYATNKATIAAHPEYIQPGNNWEKISKTSEEDYIAERLSKISKDNLKYRLSKHSHNESFRPIEFSNVPTSGFTLNKDVRRDGYWGNGHNMIRVYDPRGFEFEISVINLLFILMYVDCNSRELMGELVYSWNGKDLVLLPVGTQEYQSSVQHTADQHKKVSAKDLVPGIYKTKQGVLVKYLGKFRVYENNNYEKTCTILEKQHVFVLPEESCGKGQSWYMGKSIYQYGKSLAFLSHYVSENVDHAEDVEAFLNSKFNYQVDYSKPIYEVQTEVFPVLNYSTFHFAGLDTFTELSDEVFAIHNSYKPAKTSVVFKNIYTKGVSSKEIGKYCVFHYDGIEVKSGNYILFYNGVEFKSARIAENQINLYREDYFNRAIGSIQVDPNEFIHNIVIKKLVGYETTNGKIHNV